MDDEMSDAEYIERAKAAGLNESATWPSDERVARAYPPEHVWDLGDGRTITQRQLWSEILAASRDAARRGRGRSADPAGVA